MNDHSRYADLLPLYVSGALDNDQRRAVQEHVSGCPLCQADTALWRSIAFELGETNRRLVAPPEVVDRALARARRRPAPVDAFRRALELVHSQALVVRSEMWMASALVMALGVIVSTIVHDVAVLRMLAPLVAAASIAIIYGPESDPALELSLATSTSPWKILLARLTLVFGYDLVLALAASLGMLTFLPTETVAQLILDWLGPMTFLSEAALLLALWIGTGNAILATYFAWLIRFLPGVDIAKAYHLGEHSTFLAFLDSYRQFWSSPFTLGVMALGLLVLAARLAGRSERHLPHYA